MVPGISADIGQTDPWRKYRYDPAIQPPHPDAVYTAEFMHEKPHSDRPLIPEHFWKIARTVTHDSEFPPLTNEMVKHAEEKLGVTLPGALQEVLQSKNGGIPRMRWSLFTSFRGISGDANRFDLVNSLRRTEWGEAVEKLQLGEPVPDWEFPPEQFHLLVPICDDDPRFCYCLDYRSNGPHAEPRVTHIDAELKHDTEIAISLRALLQHFEVPELRNDADDINLHALVHTELDMRSFAEALLKSVKSDGNTDDPWMRLPDFVSEIKEGNPFYFGSSEQFNIRPEVSQAGVWIQMYSCLYHAERRPRGDGTSQYVGQLVHTFPEYPLATLVVCAPNKVARRAMRVLRACSFATLVFPTTLVE